MIKLMLNSCYGKMNSVHSALYYSDCLYKVTINGQLFILWWLEQIKSNVTDVEFIQANTDGITVKFKRKYLDLYYKACEKFTLYTNYELEYVEYKKMAIRDVNNYCVVDIHGNIKTKGEYFYESSSLKADNYHKSINFRVARRAAVMKLLFNQDYKQTILDETNIYEFIGSVKFKKSGTTASGGYFNNEDKSTNIIRFIYSKSGQVLRKRNHKHGDYAESKASIMFKNKELLECNRIVPGLIDKVNYAEYIQYSKELIQNIMYTQLDLF
jgi:hypothetical protein